MSERAGLLKLLPIRERLRAGGADTEFGTVAFIVVEGVFYAFVISFAAVGFSLTIAMFVELLR